MRAVTISKRAVRSAFGWSNRQLKRLWKTHDLYEELKAQLQSPAHQLGDLELLQSRINALYRIPGRLPSPYSLPLPTLLAQWLNELNEVVGSRKPTHPQRILFFSVMPFWVEFCLPVAIVLASRNCVVDFAWLPYSLFDREEPSIPPPTMLTRIFPSVRLHPRLKLYNLLHVTPAKATEEMRSLVKTCSKLDPPYIVRREVLDIESDENNRSLYNFRVRRNLHCMQALKTLIDNNRYDLFLTPHAGIYEFGAAFLLCRNQGLPCVSFDVCERKNSIQVGRNVPSAHVDNNDLWQEDEPHPLTKEHDEVVARYLMQRENPNWNEGDYTWHGQLAPLQPQSELLAMLGLESNKPVALLCSNIAWDAAIMGRSKYFSSMSHWILETVEWFSRRPDWQLVVRCHPGEVSLPSNEPIPDIIASRFPSLPGHIRVVQPGDPINTYGLMRISSFGMVYSSNTGLEMASRGMRVVVTGKVHYIGKGFTIEPTTREEYFATLERLTNDRTRSQLSPREYELARCYAYIYFEKSFRSFPWRDVCDMGKDLEAWPLKRLITEDCPSSYLRTFDYLSGRK